MSWLDALAKAAAPTVLSLLASRVPSVAEMIRESSHPLARRVRVRDVVPEKLATERFLDELRRGPSTKRGAE